MWIKYIIQLKISLIFTLIPVYVTQIDKYAQTEKLCATIILKVYENTFCLLVDIRLV